MTGYAVIIERSMTGYGAYAPELPGVGVTASTIDEVERLISEAIVLHVDSLREHGEPVPTPSVVIATTANRSERTITTYLESLSINSGAGVK